MGTWGAGSFDNDTALDWLDVLARLGVEALEIAFQTIAEEDEHIESDQAQIALAAAEVVAAARGHASSELPGEAREWVDAHRSAVDPSFVSAATDAVNRVHAKSDLREMWEEGGWSAWESAVSDLRARLDASR